MRAFNPHLKINRLGTSYSLISFFQEFDEKSGAESLRQKGMNGRFSVETQTVVMSNEISVFVMFLFNLIFKPWHHKGYSISVCGPFRLCR